MNRKSFIIIMSLILILSTLLIGCGMGAGDTNQNETGEERKDVTEGSQLLIYTSMYPLFDFASKIAGDKATVVNLVPAGAEPHEYDPTAKDIMDLSKAHLFVYNGGGFESWIEKLVEAVQTSNPELVILDSTASISLLTAEQTGLAHDEDEHEHEDHGNEEDSHGHEEDSHGHDHDHDKKEDSHDHAHGKEEDSHDHDDEEHEEHGDEDHGDEHGDAHEHEHGEFDPHTWLDPIIAKQQAEAITNALVQLDPENAEFYENNFAELALQFDELDGKFKELSENIERRDFVVSHAAFGYLAFRYQLNQIAIAGLDPSNEPSAKQLKEIVEFIKRNQIQYIMFENLVTPKVAEVVRDEVGAESLILHNLEGLDKEDFSQGKDYFSIMEENLENLKKALGYKQ